MKRSERKLKNLAFISKKPFRMSVGLTVCRIFPQNRKHPFLNILLPQFLSTHSAASLKMLSEKLLIFVSDKKARKQRWKISSVLFVGRWMRCGFFFFSAGISRLKGKQQEKRFFVSTNCNSSFRFYCWQTLLLPKLSSLFLFNMKTVKVASVVAVDRREGSFHAESSQRVWWSLWQIHLSLRKLQGQQKSRQIAEKFVNLPGSL